MTSTPLVSAHSLWSWSGWALGALTDAAFILSISADAVLSKHGMSGGRWATAFRWLTGAASLFLNTWTSIALGDWVGVAIHSISPLILVTAAEVAPVYRRKFRDLELKLRNQVKEFTVTKVVSRKVQSSVQASGSLQGEPVQSSSSVSQPARGSDKRGSGLLSPNQQAIRDGFLAGRKGADVAKEIGVSGSYVSAQYRKIRAELDLTA